MWHTYTRNWEKGGGAVLKNVLLTGSPGVGKTTLVKKAVRRLGERAGGFFTEEIREGDARKGFRLVSLNGSDAVLAEAGSESEHRVGHYGVKLDALENLAVPALKRALERQDVVVIDEIGLMELGSDRLIEVLQACLDSPKPVLGTIGRQDHPVLRTIRSRTDTLVIEVTKQNRDQLLDRIFAGLRLPTESFAETERVIGKKRQKADRYARENRLVITSFSGRFTSDHHVYEVACENGQWHCGCSFFLRYGTCSHTMASAKMMADRMAGQEQTDAR